MDVRDTRGRAAACRQRQREAGVPAAKRFERRERDRRSEAADHDPGGARPPSGCQPADDPERKRSDGGSGQATEQDQAHQIGQPGVVGDEELGAAPQDVEERLRHGEAPEAGDVQRGEAPGHCHRARSPWSW